MRRASTICLVRDAPSLEVLMVQRPHTSRFMPSTWVFPGGAVDDEDSDPSAAATFGTSDDWLVAALREMIEETGLWITTSGVVDGPRTLGGAHKAGHELDPSALIYFSNWITPKVFPVRFDTRFFLAVAGADALGAVDGDELVDLAWIRPIEALELEAEGRWDVAFPTRRTLEMLSTSPSSRHLADELRSRSIVPPVQPRLLVTEDEARILMPSDAGFEAAGPAQDDPEILHRLALVISKGGHLPAEFKKRS